MKPLRRRRLKTIRVTRRTAVVLEILRLQNIPAALQMLVEPVEIRTPKSLWIAKRASWPKRPTGKVQNRLACVTESESVTRGMCH
ncbi:hypothetical protein L1987_66813 [Smallanthus sonchifolius]|uniref:Uncharacterized protein n=1 Tax=Smallanthus sonchifolius TaxID=185202 RepID=A0ACB9BY65_9ASTR|nr:hypothetical protein L1987_66813 [Smallanthus sonchifolius]